VSLGLVEVEINPCADTLYPAVARALNLEFERAAPFEKLTGVEYIKNVMLIDQKAIGRSRKVKPVTYLKVYDDIRAIMPQLKTLNKGTYTGAFSFNVDGGRCPVCKGEGVEIIDMVL